MLEYRSFMSFHFLGCSHVQQRDPGGQTAGSSLTGMNQLGMLGHCCLGIPWYTQEPPLPSILLNLARNKQPVLFSSRIWRASLEENRVLVLETREKGPWSSPDSPGRNVEQLLLGAATLILTSQCSQFSNFYSLII